MSRIDTIFASLRSRNAKALMPFLVGGHPAPGSTAALLPALEQAGASIVEIGIPFSDPIADGPVIAAAMHEALKNGATPRSVFSEVQSVRGATQIGIVAMISMSIIQRMGSIAAFIAAAKEAGFDGLIVPDAPLEESTELILAAKEADIAYSHLISPTTPLPRVELIAKTCTGFVYVLARVGLTGEQSSMPNIAPLVVRVRSVTDLPIAVGFGISAPEHVAAVVAHADAAIVGSALVRRLTQAAEERKDIAREAALFVGNLLEGPPFSTVPPPVPPPVPPTSAALEASQCPEPHVEPSPGPSAEPQNSRDDPRSER